MATQNYGAAEPSPLYPNMLWFSSGDGYIKLRNPTNTAWANVGTIGPPMKWTNVDIPSTGWRAGDIKATIRGAEAGWFVMNDGTIGDQYSGATTRANPDCWEAFAYLWGAGGLPLYVAGTWTPVGRAGDWVADWNAHRHLQTPWVLGRAMASQGLGAGLVNHRYWCASDGDEYVQLVEAHLPGHYHTVPGHNHALARALPNYVGGKSTSSGPYTLADTSSGVTWTESYPGGTTGWVGSNHGHPNVGPRFYVNFLMKL